VQVALPRFQQQEDWRRPGSGRRMASSVGASSSAGATARRVFVLFPGQGSQSVGMAGAAPPAALVHASRLLGLDLVEVMRNGPKSLLDSTRFSQLSVFAHSWASFLVLREQRPELFGPSAVGVEHAFAGLSLGEYTALAAAGALRFEDAVRLVSKRAEAMQAASEQRRGVMVTLVGLEGAAVAAICARYAGPGAVCVANYLFPKAVVVSGDAAAVAWVEAEAAAAAAASGAALHCKALAVGGAFHTELMRPALASLSQALDETAFQPVPAANTVFTNVTGARYADVNDQGQVRGTLLAQLVGPVQWEATLTAIVSGFREGDLLFEVGPGKQIGAMLNRMGAPKDCLSALSSVSIEPLAPTAAASGRPALTRALSFSSTATRPDDSEQRAGATPTPTPTLSRAMSAYALPRCGDEDNGSSAAAAKSESASRSSPLRREAAAEAWPESPPGSPPGHSHSLSRAGSSASLLSSSGSLSRASSSASLLDGEGLSRASSSASLHSSTGPCSITTPAERPRADSFRSTSSTSSLTPTPLTPTRPGALSRGASFSSPTSSMQTPTELTPTRPAVAVEPPRFQRKGSSARLLPHLALL
jgi:[acyl-carrier-protein] S-malonyltransferase